MSKRSIRVVRHRPDFEPNPSFKEMVRQGQIERCIRLGLPFDMYLPKPLQEMIALEDNAVVGAGTINPTHAERLDTMHGRLLSPEEAKQVRAELFPEEQELTAPFDPIEKAIEEQNQSSEMPAEYIDRDGR